MMIINRPRSEQFISLQCSIERFLLTYSSDTRSTKDHLGWDRERERCHNWLGKRIAPNVNANYFHIHIQTHNCDVLSEQNYRTHTNTYMKDLLLHFTHPKVRERKDFRSRPSSLKNRCHRLLSEFSLGVVKVNSVEIGSYDIHIYICMRYINWQSGNSVKRVEVAKWLRRIWTTLYKYLTTLCCTV